LDIAITDIPSVISYDSLLYREASKRIETLYLCDDVCDLYPKEITNNLCSLLPHVFRNAIVYRFLVDSNFCVDYESLKIIKGVINVNSRLTYSDVNNRVNIDDKTIEMIEKMYMLAMKLRRYNTTKEKYRKIENIIKSDANYHHSLFANKSISANIIQEAMILVNSVAPEYFSRNGFVYLYRNLFIPTDEYLEGEVNKLLLASKNNVDINSPEYKAMVEQIRSIYLGAYYSNVPIGHMGIGRNYYSHSTSSARRFAGSYNQYLTYFQIFNGPISDKKYYELEKETSRLANYINMKKRENAKFESEYNYLSSKGKILRR
jgi:ribonuclease R